jgi:hypothetical protein
MSKKDAPRQKPKPSKEVLDMIRDTKAKSRKNKTAKREDFSQAAVKPRGS